MMIIIECEKPQQRSAYVGNVSTEGAVFVGHTLEQFGQVYWGETKQHAEEAKAQAEGPNATQEEAQAKKKPRGRSARRSMLQAEGRQLVSALGGAPLWVLPPCEYTTKQLSALARHFAVVKARCRGQLHYAPQVILTSDHWSQRDSFFDLVANEIVQIESEMKRDDAMQMASSREEAERFATSSPCRSVVRIRDNIVCLRGVALGSEATTREKRSLNYAEVVIPSKDWKSFAAVSRDIIHGEGNFLGSTCCSVFSTPSFLYEYRYDIQDWISKLEYGVVGVNADCGSALWVPQLRWGSFPGTKDDPSHPLTSGSRFLGNTFAYGSALRSVMHSPSWSPLRPTASSTLIASRLAHYSASGITTVRNSVPLLTAMMFGF